MGNSPVNKRECDHLKGAGKGHKTFHFMARQKEVPTVVGIPYLTTSKAKINAQKKGQWVFVFLKKE